MILSKPDLTNATILIVDDITNNLQLLSTYLKKANYKVLIAQNGKKAFETATALRPDLILLDIMMPEINGLDTCRYLKRSRETQDIPIIFMTALAEAHYKVEGFKLGAVDYVTKPFEESELLARIRTHLTLTRLHQNSLQEAARRKILFEIGDRIRQSLDLEVIIDTATKEIRTLLDCDFVGLTAVNKQKVTVEAHDTAPTINSQPETVIPLKSICPTRDIYQSYLQGHVEVINEARTNSFIYPDLAPQAKLILPILIRDTNYTSGFFSAAEDTLFSTNILYGWLIVTQYSTERTWKPVEVDLLREITTQLAIAIKQALFHKQISQLALLDSLTRVYNRRSFDRQLKREWGRLKRIRAPLSLIMCDVDCFKIYNDVYGHQEGDSLSPANSKIDLKGS